MKQEEDSRIREAVLDYIQPTLNRAKGNLSRVSFLLQTADAVPPVSSVPLATHRGDLLRAAVVFLHATLEDFLRYIGELYLPCSEEEWLNRIPLCGCGDSLRPEKFLLGKLANHRGKSVDQVIRDSVSAHLERQGFSDVSDISTLLKACRVESDTVKKSYAQLATLMARRHRIVHKGDLTDIVVKGERQVEDISSDEVKEWLECVQTFIAAVLTDKMDHELLSRIQSSPELRESKKTK